VKNVEGQNPSFFHIPTHLNHFFFSLLITIHSSLSLSTLHHNSLFNLPFNSPSQFTFQSHFQLSIVTHSSLSLSTPHHTWLSTKPFLLALGILVFEFSKRGVFYTSSSIISRRVFLRVFLCFKFEIFQISRILKGKNTIRLDFFKSI
jgi:hypothetical protein